MKKLTAMFLLVAFAATPVMQAGEGATCDKAKNSCGEKAKVTAQTKSSCSEATACCESAKKPAVTSVKPDEKGAALLVRIQSDSRVKS